MSWGLREGDPVPSRAHCTRRTARARRSISGVDDTVEAHAALMAELAVAGRARTAVLARHGLDEAAWEAIDARWQEALSAALDDDGDGVAEILSRHAAAYQQALRSLTEPISLEQLALITRRLQATGDLGAALARSGVALADYVRGAEHWSARMATDPEAELRFQEMFAGRSPSATKG